MSIIIRIIRATIENQIIVLGPMSLPFFFIVFWTVKTIRATRSAQANTIKNTNTLMFFSVKEALEIIQCAAEKTYRNHSTYSHQYS